MRKKKVRKSTEKERKRRRKEPAIDLLAKDVAETPTAINRATNDEIITCDGGRCRALAFL